MTITTYHKLPPENILQYKIFDEESSAWEKKMTPKKRLSHDDKFCSHKDRFLFILATSNNKVLGQAILLKRPITYKNKLLFLGGIGGVHVLKKMRRQGIATLLLKEAVKQLHLVKCDLAYLCCDINDKNLINLYGQVGFVLLNKPHSYLGRSGKRYTDKDGMIAPIANPEVFQQILTDNTPFDIGTGNW